MAICQKKANGDWHWKEWHLKDDKSNFSSVLDYCMAKSAIA